MQIEHFYNGSFWSSILIGRTKVGKMLRSLHFFMIQFSLYVRNLKFSFFSIVTLRYIPTCLWLLLFEKLLICWWTEFYFKIVIIENLGETVVWSFIFRLFIINFAKTPEITRSHIMDLRPSHKWIMTKLMWTRSD